MALTAIDSNGSTCVGPEAEEEDCADDSDLAEESDLAGDEDADVAMARPVSRSLPLPLPLLPVAGVWLMKFWLVNCNCRRLRCKECLIAWVRACCCRFGLRERHG